MNCAKKVEEKKHHFCIEISDIGLSSKEEKEIEHLKKKIEENIEKIKKKKNENLEEKKTNKEKIRYSKKRLL